MTGFGKAVKIFNNKKITAEIKSLNSKQADLSMRLPTSYREVELELRSMVSTSLLRGKIDIMIYCEANDNSTLSGFNIPLLKQYKEQIDAVSTELGIAPPVDWYCTLMRMPDAIKNDLSNSDVGEDELNAVRETVREAVDALIEFRAQEGRRLASFFEDKIANIQALLDEVPQYETSRIEKVKARIMDGLSKLENVSVDSNRFDQELIFYIEKLDITEEKIRLQNHLNYVIDTMNGEMGQGKKLGFIAQEMGREINTTGSKANDAELQKIVVRMKDHLEQIKEQVLNVL